MATERDGVPVTGGGWNQRVTVSLESTSDEGFHEWDPQEETGVRGVNAVRVVAQSDPSFSITWNHEEGRFDIHDLADAEPAPAETDAGEVRVEVHGDR